MNSFSSSYGNPTINFVGRANANNWVTITINEIKDLKPYPAWYMTLSLWWEYLWSCFIQEKPFYTSQNVVVLKPKRDMSFYVKQFISVMVFKEWRTFYKAFVDELNRHIKRDFSILVPVDWNWNPDREYMENYMKNLEEKCKKELELLKKWRETEKSKINTNLWKEFKVGELLQMQHQIELSPIDAFNNNIPNDITYPFYGQSSENNGIIDFYYLFENLLNNKDSDHCIMIHSNTHLAYHVNTPFYLKDGHGATTIFTNDNLNKFSVFFLIAVLNKTMDRLFDYDIKATKEKLKNLIVKLPVDSEWNPNRDFMEKYIKNLMEKNREKLKCLN